MGSSYSASFMVLLYGKEIADSETFNSLQSLSLPKVKKLLVIWNNGPKKLNSYKISEFESMGFDVIIRETINNESLSKIYNNFITNVRSDKYIILDDDSQLNQSYVESVFKLTVEDIGVPQIFSKNKQTFPKKNRKLCFVGEQVSDKDRFFGIGSGLVIGAEITKKLIVDHNDIFDERFYFYGVDSTFFFRIKQSNLSRSIKVISGFEHSLSKFKKESDTVTEFRLKEMSYDIGLRLRYYKPFSVSIFLLLKESLASLVKQLRNKKPKILSKYLLKAYFSGKHYKY